MIENEGNLKKKELIEFKNELLIAYQKLTGRTAIELFNIPYLKSQEKRNEIKQAFINRTCSDFKKIIQEAVESSLKSSPSFRFTDFLNRLFVAFTAKPKQKSSLFGNGYLQLVKEEEARKQRKIDEAASQGKTLEEYEEEEYQAFKAEIERIKSSLPAPKFEKKQEENRIPESVLQELEAKRQKKQSPAIDYRELVKSGAINKMFTY